MSGLIFLVVTSVSGHGRGVCSSQPSSSSHHLIDPPPLRVCYSSFLAGALPLSISLTQSQLRFVASLGAGLLVGSCLIVIVPEGIEAIASASSDHHHDDNAPHRHRRDDPPQTEDDELPAFHIGLSLILGFALMFLIDRLPRHLTDRFTPPPQSRHVSLDNLSTHQPDSDLEDESFLGSLTPSPKQSRSLATTIGLVIHAAADGVAMGASATTSNMNVGLIIFFAILVHKAPAAFGLTSTLLKQGLSKRAARVHLMVFSLAAPVGALVTYFMVGMLGGEHLEGEEEGGKWWTGMLLLFSGGTFLYVAMHAMQEENSFGVGGHDHAGQGGGGGYSEVGNGGNRRGGRLELRDTLGTVVGMLLPLATRFGHHHHH
uniref:Transporter n=1 Tax=Podospora anserina (strain S / ATCC MYA-4624 / DSM 980 / FGSC 10383) TaxID=515849 RepID=A0A090CX39_PODAN|nr:Putative transporter [Podospora anserina S mat+]